MLVRLAIVFAVASIVSQARADEVVATWYGNELRGHRTASGVAFDPDGLTAAHRTLPFGTCLIIQNPKTGKVVQVTVNDRGPFTKGLTLDLSAGAAKAIGMASRQEVAMAPCPPLPTPAPTAADPASSASLPASPVVDKESPEARTPPP